MLRNQTGVDDGETNAAAEMRDTVRTFPRSWRWVNAADRPVASKAMGRLP